MSVSFTEDLRGGQDLRLSQDKRIGALYTPLGKDTLVLTRLEAGEGLSELFEYRIDALSERENIDFDSAIGQNCCVTIKTYGKERAFNGVLVEAQWVGVREAHYAYRLVLRPWPWLLSNTATCRIFKDKTAPEIIKQVFSDKGFSDFRDSLTESYQTMEYCVQYRETDLSFVMRLMEHHGIYFFFEHSRDKHMLVLADAPASHQPAGGTTVPFLPRGERNQRDREHFYHWISERRFRPGKYELTDYDFKRPNADLFGRDRANERYTRSDLEVFDWPGKHVVQADGERFAKVRLTAEQALDKRRHAAGDAASLYPGRRFKLDEHPTAAENGEHLVVRCAHAFVAERYRTGTDDAPEETYYGTYEFLRADRRFKAPMLTPKPVVHGPQTAKVVAEQGKESEEIDVDEHGRIYVKFFWDRDKKTYSRRVRVSQLWSGKRWGGQFIPRIGQEVVVIYLEGDPDEPLVVGTVYNGDNKYPYEMPANKTQSGIKSDSSKGGNGYNEFMFEDKKGEEKIRMHAEKDRETVIRHAETREIGETFETPVGSPSRETTLKHGDDNLTIDTGDWKVHVKQSKIKIEAAIEIKLICGQSKITMTPGSISIESLDVRVKGTTTDVEGSAMLNLHGAMVMIN